MKVIFSISKSLITNIIDIVVNAYQKSNGIFGGLYFLQYVIYVLIAKIFQRKCEKNICEYYYSSPDIEKLGIVTSKAEWDIEKPLDFSCNPEYSHDKVLFYSGNSNGDCFMVHITRKNSCLGEVSLFLKLANKGCYELPIHPNIDTVLHDLRDFSGGGLEIKCLSPFRRWRISYNGLLRDIDDPNDCGKHVKFSFVWMPVSAVTDLQTNYSSYLLAESVLKSGWKIFANFNSVLEQLNSYDHWGESIGTVIIDNDPEQELYLWGIRRRSRNTHNCKDTSYGVKFYGYLLNGFIFHFGIFSISNTKLKCVPYGYIILPNHKIVPIDSFDGKFLKMCEDGNFEDCFNVWFKAGKYRYSLSIDQTTKAFDNLNNDNFTTRRNVRCIKCELNNVTGHGIVEYISRNEEKLIPARKDQTPLKVLDECKVTEIPMVVKINDDISKLKHVSGGKGSSLSCLSSLMNSCKETNGINFIVPDGIILTTAAYYHHLKCNKNILQSIFTIENNLSYQNIESNKLEDSCYKIIGEFNLTSLDNCILEEIKKQLFNNREENAKRKMYAVRSSAVGEDNAEFSAAGQMITFLGLCDINEICDAVIKCWSSQFSYSAVQYKRKNGQPVDSGMAVVIQEIIYPEVSGVLFTCDPVTCNPANITITANYGLGESVVSALTEPDTIILKRSIDGNISFHSKSLGEKKVEIVVTDKGKTERTIKKEKSTVYCLNENQAILLGKISIQLEAAFNELLDIEWGIIGNTVYLLQARAITTVKKESQFEIMHEFDTGILAEYEYSTTANLGEVMPGAMSPLTMSTVVWALDLPIKAVTYIQEGRFLSTYNWTFYQTFLASQQHIFFNMLDFVLMRNEKQKTFASCIWEVCLLGRLLKDGEEMKSKAIERHGYFSTFAKTKGLANIALVVYNTYRKRKFMKKKYSNYIIEYDTYSQAYDLFQNIHKCLVDLCEIAQFHIMTSMLSSVYTTFILTFLEKDCNEKSEVIFAKFSQLLSHCSEVHSADVPSSLKKLAEAISEDRDKAIFRNLSPEDAYQWLKENKSIPGKAYASFMQSHGYRCLKEYDLYSVRWEEKPLELIKCIQAMLNNKKNGSTEERALSVEEAVNELGISAGFIKRKFLELLTSWGRHGVRTREESKALMVKTLKSFRQAYLHLGKLMTKEYRLPDAELIFFLTHDEIGEIIHEHSSRLVYKI
ncbi:rifampicin phosphotransferase-like isoform X2 [Centruroides vittatus]|uniref:rifampicin phosphotransferase-like isoform X2 n=1 Tax=Centruroides vittatus TaxID=120091 RepID=UPI00350F8253